MYKENHKQLYLICVVSTAFGLLHQNVHILSKSPQYSPELYTVPQEIAPIN
jgi:hypothetical protein